MRPGVFDE
jgi:hypothetical protein